MADLKPKFKKEIQMGISSGYVQEFSISRINFARHIIAVVLTVLLCFSLIMSEITRFNQSHQIASISKMTLIYILLIVFSLFMAIKAIVSIKRVKVSQQGIELTNLFWHEKLNWQELNTLNSPKSLRFSWISTKHSIYLFIKNEIENYNDLESLIEHHLSRKS